MAWFFGAVALVCFFAFPAFRKFVGFAIVAGGLTAGAVYFHNEQEEAESLTRIGVSEIEIDKPLLVRDNKYFVGRLRNLSQRYSISSVTVRIWIRDCPSEEAKPDTCDVVADTTSYIYQLVPPGQTRDFSEYVVLPEDFAIRGYMQWGYSVQAIRANGSDA
jgi:hypothetical protein